MPPTSGPSSSTTPTPEWPRIVGSRLPSSPRWLMQSVTQNALAVVRTTAPFAAGGRSSTSSTTSGLPNSSRIAAFTGEPPVTRSMGARLCAASRDTTRLHADGDLGGSRSPVRLPSDHARRLLPPLPDLRGAGRAAADGLLLLGVAQPGRDDSRGHRLGPGPSCEAWAHGPPRAASRDGAARDPAGHDLPHRADAPALGPHRQRERLP